MFLDLIKKYCKITFSIFLVFLFLQNINAIDVLELFGTPLHDYARLLLPKEKNALEKQLLDIDKRGTFQMAILTVKSLSDTDIETYAVSVFEKWGLGEKGKDTGVLLVVSLEDHKLRIEVGYGLEGVLTDAKCGIIIRNIIAPNFKAEKYFEGLKEAVSAIENEIEGDGSTIKDAEKSTGFGSFKNIALIIFVILFLLLRSSRGFGFFIPFGGGFGGKGGGGFSGGGGKSGGGGASGGW